MRWTALHLFFIHDTHNACNAGKEIDLCVVVFVGGMRGMCEAFVGVMPILVMWLRSSSSSVIFDV